MVSMHQFIETALVFYSSDKTFLSTLNILCSCRNGPKMFDPITVYYEPMTYLKNVFFIDIGH